MKKQRALDRLEKRDRTSQRGQVLAYSGICFLTFFSLAAVAVDIGRHVFVGREVQVVADAQALAGATALARTNGDITSSAYQDAVKSFAQRNAVEGATTSTVTPVPGHWSTSGGFAAGSPYNAVQSTASFTIGNIFAMFSRSSTISRTAVAAFTPAPTLPIALCNGSWYSGLTFTFRVSNQSDTAKTATAAWAMYDPGNSTFNNANMNVLPRYLPAACGGTMTPPQEVIGGTLLLGNGVGPLFNSSCSTSPTGLGQCLPGKTYTVPITNLACGGPMNQQQTIVGFVTVRIDSVGCDNSSPVCGASGGPCLVGHVITDCSTDWTACPEARLVR
jgi:Flp pilus assembly protein TadG